MLIPFNKHLIVKPAEENTETSSVLLPEGVEIKRQTYKPYKVMQKPSNSTLQCDEIVIVPEHMVERLDCFGNEYYLVLENHVVAIYQPTDQVLDHEHINNIINDSTFCFYAA